MKDKLIKFEEDNFDWLIDKFLKLPHIIGEWSQFIEDEYCKKLPDEDMGER